MTISRLFCQEKWAEKWAITKKIALRFYTIPPWKDLFRDWEEKGWN